MIADRDLKARVLRFVAAKRWFPQLEMDVLVRTSSSRSRLLITDIDVLALIPDEIHAFRKALIDCKSGKGESPITRALWLKGLMVRLGADRGLCVLKRDRIEKDHRYEAAQFRVSLFTEADFEKFVIANGVLSFHTASMLADISLWEEYFNIGLQYPKLKDAVTFSKSGFWASENYAEACRKTIATLRQFSRELDPTKRSHVALVADIVSLFMVSLYELVFRVFAENLQPEKKEELAHALLLMLYGGQESYEFRSRLLKEYATSKHGEGSAPNLVPPLWEDFVQLVRQALDAPFETARSPLLLRELAWSRLAGESSSAFLGLLASESPQAAKISILGIEYLCKAAHLPDDFARGLIAQLVETLKPVPKG